MRFPFQLSATTAAECHDFSFSFNKIYLDAALLRPVAAQASKPLRTRSVAARASTPKRLHSPNCAKPVLKNAKSARRNPHLQDLPRP
jgi:hypothetical protein